MDPSTRPSTQTLPCGRPAVLERIQAGRLRSATPSQLSHAIVTVLTREQEDFIETLTKDVWQLEQQLTGGDVGDPEKYLNELFRARHGLLAVRTMGAQSGAIYHSMTTLTGISPMADSWWQITHSSLTGSAAWPTVRRNISTA